MFPSGHSISLSRLLYFTFHSNDDYLNFILWTRRVFNLCGSDNASKFMTAVLGVCWFILLLKSLEFSHEMCKRRAQKQLLSSVCDIALSSSIVWSHDFVGSIQSRSDGLYGDVTWWTMIKGGSNMDNRLSLDSSCLYVLNMQVWHRYIVMAALWWSTSLVAVQRKEIWQSRDLGGRQPTCAELRSHAILT